MRLVRLALVSVLTATSIVSRSQSINLDSNEPFASPPLGGGVPSSSFGGAVNQPGYWEKFSAAGVGPTLLKGLSGQLTSVVLETWGFTTGTGFNQPLNTGDFCALLNDHSNISSIGYFQFTGFSPGTYFVTTYGVRSSGAMANCSVTVVGSTTPNPQVCTGPMPGNQLILGITHTQHLAAVLSGTLMVRVDRIVEVPVINGFQIVQVSSYAFPTSYTVTQGLNFGGSIASIQSSDDDRASILNDEFDTNGEFEFTSTLPARAVSQLKFKFEGRASRSDLSQFLKMRNYATGLYTNVNVQTATLNDSIAEGSISSGANNYFSASREVKARATWIPQLDVDTMDGWVESCDQAMWEMVF